MPVYEYQCQACHHRFEARQKFSDAPLEHCPACNGPVQKQISLPGFSLKGGGWAQQGYSGSAAQPAACPSSGGGGCAGCPKAANQ